MRSTVARPWQSVVNWPDSLNQPVRWIELSSGNLEFCFLLFFCPPERWLNEITMLILTASPTMSRVGVNYDVTTMRIRSTDGVRTLTQTHTPKQFYLYSMCVLSSVAGRLFIVPRKRLSVSHDAFDVNKSQTKLDHKTCPPFRSREKQTFVQSKC